MRMKIEFIVSAILALSAVFLLAKADLVEDKHALLDFIANIDHSRNLNWDGRTSVCKSWIGVTCNGDSSRVIAVRLPAIGLAGIIPPNTLGRLSALQILSLRSNGIYGAFPDELLKLGNLTGLFLQFNNFHGPLPSDFSVWKYLSLLNLSNNSFNGSIPSSIMNLTRLTSLNLANNSLSGDIPDLNISSMKLLDLSHNHLTGVVPKSLLRFPSSAFTGNNLSLENEPVTLHSPPVVPENHSSKFSEPEILGVVIGTCVMAFLAMMFLLLFINRSKGVDEKPTVVKSEKQEKSIVRMASNSRDGNGRLVFFEGRNLVFDLEDLLRASAEVLGKGTHGTTYKAALEDATIVAVKRLKEVHVGRKDFEHQMDVLGSIRHENVASLRGYYYSKDEKLMVYDYFNRGSLSMILHAAKGSDERNPLDWESRLKIAKGAARGIAYIHSQNSGKLVHGNIKASNIFLDSNQHGIMSDAGLAMLMNPITSSVVRIPGYRAPEVASIKKFTQASDVYSFGVVMLELLTGKSPVLTSGSGGEAIHLVRWVNSVVREEWTGEVFDVELLKYRNIEEEMVEMLQISLNCVARTPEQRPKMGDVVRMIEDVASGSREGSVSAETRSTGSTPQLRRIATSSAWMS